MTRAKKDNESDRSGSVPAPDKKTDKKPTIAKRRRAGPMRGLEFLDGVLGDPIKTRNAIRLVCTVSVCMAIVIGAVGAILIFAPSAHAQWIATVLLSSAGTILMGVLGIRIHDRRNRSNADEDSDA